MLGQKKERVKYKIIAGHIQQDRAKILAVNVELHVARTN